MQITLNGEPHEVEEEATVASLITSLQLRQPRFAVEINEQIIRRDEYEGRRLLAGDRVEVITFVGGG